MANNETMKLSQTDTHSFSVTHELKKPQVIDIAEI